MKKPNILFIMTDEHKFDCVGYQNKEVITPFLDALKEDSIHFCNGYTTNPSCVPARAAIFSGKYPSECGAPAYITPLDAHETTFMETLQHNGYHTAVVGKQHFAGSAATHGYDDELIVDMHFPDFDEPSPYVDFLKANGFHQLSDVLVEDDKFTKRWAVDPKFHVDSYIGEHALEWIAQSDKIEKPWYLCVSFPGPHQPFNGIGLEEEALYDESTLSLPETKQNDLLQKPDYYMEQLRSGKGNPGEMPVIDATEAQIRHTRKSYYATVTAIDKKIGAILQALKDKGEYDNTLIFFTADHGEYMGEFGMFGKGQYLSEALMRVPFLMKPPIAGFQGREEQGYALNFDIAATCLDVCGCDYSELSCKSLVPFYDETRTETARKYLYTEALNVRGVQSKDYKLIYYQNRDYGELYDLKADPLERKNLWKDTRYAAVKVQLVYQLCNQMIDLGNHSHSLWNYAAPVI